jgi:hypothetical protein
MAEAITLYDASGNRKFVTREERDRFLRTAATCLGEVRTLCGVLAYTAVALIPRSHSARSANRSRARLAHRVRLLNWARGVD